MAIDLVFELSDFRLQTPDSKVQGLRLDDSVLRENACGVGCNSIALP